MNIKNTKINMLPDWIKEMTSLESLDISYTLIKELPDWIKISNISTLTIDENQIKLIPEWKNNMLNIMHLDLTRIYLPKLPKELGLLTHLRSLILSEVELDEVPDWIRNFKNLENLNLSKNHLKILPDEIASLRKLKRLELDNNKLSDVLVDLTPLRSLKYFDLSSNQISELTPQIWEFLAGLKIVNLDHNKFNYRYLSRLHRNASIEDHAKLVNFFEKIILKTNLFSADEKQQFEKSNILEIDFLSQEHKTRHKNLIGLNKTLARTFYALILGVGILQHYKEIFTQIPNFYIFVLGVIIVTVLYGGLLWMMKREEKAVVKEMDEFVEIEKRQKNLDIAEFTKIMREDYYNLFADMTSERYQLLQNSLFNIFVSSGGGLFLSLISILTETTETATTQSDPSLLNGILLLIFIITFVIFITISYRDYNRPRKERNEIRKKIKLYLESP